MSGVDTRISPPGSIRARLGLARRVRARDAQQVEDAPPVPFGGRLLGLGSDLAELSKLRVNLLVLATAFAGYLLAPAGGSPAPGSLGWLIAGVWLLASSSSAFNQLLERRDDGLMRRTRSRPLPSRRIGAVSVASGSAVFALLGLAILAARVNAPTALLGAVTLVTYLLVYTPLKKRTPHSLPVGAVAGALPPVMGWAAAGGEAGSGAGLLFALLFLWQVPHFHAIAWLHRHDYVRGGFRLLAVVEPTGRVLSAETILYVALLLAWCPLPVALAGAAVWFLIPAGLSGAALLALAFWFARRRSEAAARSLLYASLAYLPLILGFWILASR